jgi:hypothetical protein
MILMFIQNFKQQILKLEFEVFQPQRLEEQINKDDIAPPPELFGQNEETQIDISSEEVQKAIEESRKQTYDEKDQQVMIIDLDSETIKETNKITREASAEKVRVEMADSIQPTDKRSNNQPVQTQRKSCSVRKYTKPTDQSMNMLYCCELCPMKFRNKNTIVHHLKQIHLLTYNCEICKTDFINMTEVAVHAEEVHCSKDVEIYAERFNPGLSEDSSKHFETDHPNLLV